MSDPVTRAFALARSRARGIFLMLAALAIVMKVMIPTGFMTAPAETNGLPFALVLCTDQGARIVAPGADLGTGHDPAPADAAGHDSPCPFAGLGVADAPPSGLTATAVAFAVDRPAAAIPRVRLAPGRGLAAPPPPARGPPSLLI